MKKVEDMTMREKVRYGAIIGTAGLFLAASMFQARSVNPIKIIGTLFEKGIPFKTMGILFIFTILAIGFILVISAKGGVEKDVLGRRFYRATDKQAYGDVHFETPQEFEKIAIVQTPEKAFGTILGQMDDTGTRLINQRMNRNRDNRHIMVVGASGSGKSFTFTKPYCYQVVKRRESVVITDPDGGLYRDMAGYFQDNGYVVRRFDLKDLLKSDGWACLNAVKGANPELNAQLFANTVISNLANGGAGIYADGPMTLLKACLLRVVLGSDYSEEEKTIESVYELLQNPAGEDYLNAKFDPYTLPEGAEPCLGPYMSFKQSSPNLRGNIITNLAVDLQLLQNKDVCRVLSTDDIDLELPGKQPCAYFCIFPDLHDTNQFLVSLFFSMLFIKLIDFADHTPTGQCPVPVNFLLDEFPSIGKLPDWHRKMATIRKRAMNAVMILQDITQLKQNYEETWVTLLSNCATFVSLGINDGETANLVSKRIGETTVQVETEKRAAVESIFTTFRPTSVGGGKRNLMNYDELFRVDEDAVIILAQKHNPIYAHKYPHTLHPEAAKAKDRQILTEDIPDITDIEARKRKREKEDAYVAEYLKRHPLSEVDRSYAKVCEPDIQPTIWLKFKEGLAEYLKEVLNIKTLDEMIAPWEVMEDDTDDSVWDEDFVAVEVEEMDFQLPETLVVDDTTGEVLHISDEPSEGDSAAEAVEVSPQPVSTGEDTSMEPEASNTDILHSSPIQRQDQGEDALKPKQAPTTPPIQKRGGQGKKPFQTPSKGPVRIMKDSGSDSEEEPPLPSEDIELSPEKDGSKKGAAGKDSPPPEKVLSPQTKDYPKAMYEGVKSDPKPTTPQQPVPGAKPFAGGHGKNKLAQEVIQTSGLYRPHPTMPRKAAPVTPHIQPPKKVKHHPPQDNPPKKP